MRRQRMMFYATPEMQERIANLAIRRKLSQSALIEAAVAAFLAPEGTARFEVAVFALHLDRIERDLRRLERHAIVTAEMVALFLRFWLSVTPSLPQDAQTAARATGKRRYTSFIAALGARVKRGDSFLGELRAHLENDEAETQAARSQAPGSQDAGATREGE